MNFTDQLLPPGVSWPANLLAGLLLALAVRRAPWQRLKDEAQLHLWLGTCVTLMAVWSIKTGIKPGLDFHLLGATLMGLMFGPQLAMIGFAVVLTGVTLAGAAGWQGFGANLLVMAAVPVLFSFALHKTSQRRLPNHLFVYLLLDAFLCSALAIAVSGLAGTLLLGVAGVYRWSYLLTQHLPFYVLLGWSEAMITGMAVTMMAAYRPHWLGTFSDARYLKS
jgi:uncharacterized membrane protein